MSPHFIIEKLYKDIEELELSKKRLNSEVSVKGLDEFIKRKKREISSLRDQQLN